MKQDERVWESTRTKLDTGPHSVRCWGLRQVSRREGGAAGNLEAVEQGAGVMQDLVRPVQITTVRASAVSSGCFRGS